MWRGGAAGPDLQDRKWTAASPALRVPWSLPERVPGDFWGSLASGSRKERGGREGGWGGGPGYGEPCGLAGLSRVLTPERQTEGQLPRSAPLLSSPVSPRGETYHCRGGQGGVGRRDPALREATASLCPTAAPLQRPSPLLPPGLASNPSFAPALVSPGFSGSGLSHCDQTLRSQSISAPELLHESASLPPNL